MHLKKLIIIASLLLVVLVPLSVFAQSSSTVETRVGNPKTNPGGEAPPPPSNIRQGIIDKFGIIMSDRFSETHLQWTWERLHEAGSGFTDHLRGTRVEPVSGISGQVGCFGGGVSLYLGQYQPKEFFKFMVLHEFGHVFQACNSRSVTKQVEQINAYNAEGGISYYARTAITCFPGEVTNQNEDYADMIAYYLDRLAGWSSGAGSCKGPINPPNPYNTGYPLHLSVVKSIFNYE